MRKALPKFNLQRHSMKNKDLLRHLQKANNEQT